MNANKIKSKKHGIKVQKSIKAHNNDITKQLINVCIVSKAVCGKNSSIIPKSLENRFSIIPIGVLSKNEILAFIRDSKRRLCKLTEALIHIVKNELVLKSENKNRHETKEL